MPTQERQTGQPEEEGRRGFITKCIYLLASLISGTLLASVGTYLGGTPKPDDDEWADAGDISELHAGVPQELVFARTKTDAWRVRNEKSTAWVILDAQNRLTAFSPRCPHLGCAYHWESKKKLFLCPCHGSEFKETGEVSRGPAGRPLDRYPVKIEGDRLWLGPLPNSSKS
jgi:menaquinol-cytochrome c reductase iron-sulfur subunit